MPSGILACVVVTDCVKLVTLPGDEEGADAPQGADMVCASAKWPMPAQMTATTNAMLNVFLLGRSRKGVRPRNTTDAKAGIWL